MLHVILLVHDPGLKNVGSAAVRDRVSKDSKYFYTTEFWVYFIANIKIAIGNFKVNPTKVTITVYIRYGGHVIVIELNLINRTQSAKHQYFTVKILLIARLFKTSWGTTGSGIIPVN